MKMIKKVLSLLVVLCMALSMVCIPTFAANEDAVVFKFVDGTLKQGGEEIPMKYSYKESLYNGTQYLYMNTKEYGLTSDLTVEGSVTLPKTGYYKVTYLISQNTGTAAQIALASNITLNIGKYSANNNSEAYIRQFNTEGYKNTRTEAAPTYVAQYEQTYYFDNVNVDINMAVSVASNYDYLKFSADYVKFEYMKNPVFDLVNYGNGNEIKKANGNVYMNYYKKTNAADEFQIPVIFDKAGTYTVTYFTGAYTNAKSQSPVTFSLIDSEGTSISIGNNKRPSSYTDYKSYYSTLRGATTLCKFTKTVTVPSAGEYTLNVKITAATSGSSGYYQLATLDIIEFVHEDNKAVADANGNICSKAGHVVTATANYAEAVSGTPILALYEGDELVYSKVGNAVTDATKVTFSEFTLVDYTDAKVLIWEDTTNTLKPVAAAITFTN